MKFGKQLANRVHPEWRFYYMEYDKLKEMIKEKTDTKSHNLFSEDDEAAFVETLEKEVAKIENFRNMKVDELERKIQHYEEVFSRINIGKLNENAFEHFKQEFEKIGFELGTLGRYTRLNFTGIVKILKKHDKYTSYRLKPMFLLHFRNNPLYVNNMDSLLLRLSNLYNRLSSPSASPSGTGALSKHGGSETFVRKTTKYWVHPDNVTDVKLAILKHLPVIVYNSNGNKPQSHASTSQNLDFAVSSVYLDNSSLELYLGRLEKTEGAEAIRIRWYGKSHNPEFVFIERKVHKEDWTGEISVKSRFQLKEKHVADFITGNYTLEKALMKKRLLKQQDEESIEELSTLSAEVQEAILTKKLKPIVRTKYNRMAFQYPGDATVRISLDTELVMVREGNLEPGMWKRNDITSEEYPYPEIPDGDIVRFPYAILEVKLQTESGELPPKWITDLVNSPLVEEVPKFSKFIHGIAVLYEKKVQLFPFWISQMNVDIRQQKDTSTPLTSPFRSADSFAEGTITPLLVASSESKSPQHEYASDDHIAIDIKKSEEECPLLLKPALKSKSLPSNIRERVLSTSSSTTKKRSPRESPMMAIANSRNNRIQTTNRISSAGSKRIAVPVRVEPKVFFANERTFLSWLHFSIFLGGVSTALVGLGHHTAKISGYIFTIVSILFSFYALYTYHWRAQKIRERDPGPYDDLWGPSFLVVVFLLAMVINLIFTLIKEQQADGDFISVLSTYLPDYVF